MKASDMGDDKTKRLGFHESDLNSAFFKNTLKGINKDATLISWSRKDFDSGTNGIVTALLGDQSDVNDKRLLGFLSFSIKYKLDNNDDLFEKNVVLKIKTRGKAAAEMFRDLAQKLGGEIAEGYRRFYMQFGLINAEHRDITALTLNEPCLEGIRPKIYHHVCDDDKEIFAYVMEDFNCEGYSHLDTANNLEQWSDNDIMDVLHGIASFHARFYGRTGEIPSELTRWVDDIHTMSKQPEFQFLWSAMLEEAHEKFPDLVDGELVRILRCTAANITNISTCLDESPHTLIHNDLNNRNICLRTGDHPGLKRLCAYDWEMTGTGCPQRDAVEFLAFTLPENTTVETWEKYREAYRSFLSGEVAKHAIPTELKSSIDASLETTRFQNVFDMSIIELLYIRLMMYCATHQFINLPFLKGVMANVGTYVKSLSHRYDFLRADV